MSVTEIIVDITGTVVTGVRQAGGITIIVMKAAGIGFITNRLRRHRRATGITSTGMKVRLPATGVMVLRGIGVKARLLAAGNHFLLNG
jgi:hypothetical protein